MVVPAIPIPAPVRSFRRGGAGPAEEHAYNDEGHRDPTHNVPFAVGVMHLGTELAREWLAQALMKVCVQVRRHPRIVKKRTTIADTLTGTLLCLERDRITRRWLCRQGIEERRLHYFTEAKDFAIVCQARSILWSLCHEVVLHVQVDVVLVLEGFTGVVTNPGSPGPSSPSSFGSALILLMPPEDIN